MSAAGNPDLPGLQLLSRGKVRDIYATSSPELLLFIATDRSRFRRKGALLTEISLFCPARAAPHASMLRGRAMLVRRARVVPIEAIVRGYLTGSAWSEYKRSGTRFPEPIFTPSTKAEQGAHDENISPAQAEALLGSELYTEIRRISLALYSAAAAHALARGIILADTNGTLILIDELLTPDSSRYWPLSEYAPGRAQPSFDKQFLRDWMLRAGFERGREGGPPGHDGEGWVAEEEVVRGTKGRYEEVVQRLQGESVV
ncbi:hypothetical protein BD779DRAFT_1610718 [Infundibulicybe gibba]|nr:hypothetical protein BD779DRAFT_1610718 [Infundibulicybe gibba]